MRLSFTFPHPPEHNKKRKNKIFLLQMVFETFRRRSTFGSGLLGFKVKYISTFSWKPDQSLYVIPASFFFPLGCGWLEIPGCVLSSKGGQNSCKN